MIKKISIFIIILTLIISIIPIKTYATIFDPVIDPKTYGADLKNNEDSEELTTITNTILGIIQVAGTFISVISTMIIGVKYMLGSIQEKAQYKETMVPYVIGIVLLFVGVNILKPIYKLVTGMLN